MLISFEQLLENLAMAIEAHRQAALAARFKNDGPAAMFNEGAADALKHLGDTYAAAVRTGKLHDEGKRFYIGGAAVALAVERFLVWLASMAQWGLELEAIERRRMEKAALVADWLKNGP